jgi:hypothetical protein
MGSRRRVSIPPGLLIAASLVLAAACGQSAGTQPAPNSGSQATAIEVVNHSSSDMEIFLLRMGERVRIGMAPANIMTKFEVLPVQAAGAGTVRFLARPVLPGLSSGATSDPMVLHPGDVIQLDVPGP